MAEKLRRKTITSFISTACTDVETFVKSRTIVDRQSYQCHPKCDSRDL